MLLKALAGVQGKKIVPILNATKNLHSAVPIRLIILTNEPVYLLSAMTMDTGNKYLLYWLCPYGKGFFPVLYSVVYLKNVLAAMTCSQQTTVIMKMTHIYLTPQVMYLDAATTSSARATTKSQIHPAAPDVSNNTTRYCQMTRSALPYQQPEAFHV
ncbi:uncharacterized protein [Miscanthus floridulus]|uniref:uncharacterized protein isoform X2 n=1 Tax=Miscanthus floridulus TaxID=154761 RepID=UPI00345B25CF